MNLKQNYPKYLPFFTMFFAYVSYFLSQITISFKTAFSSGTNTANFSNLRTINDWGAITKALSILAIVTLICLFVILIINLAFENKIEKLSSIKIILCYTLLIAGLLTFLFTCFAVWKMRGDAPSYTIKLTFGSIIFFISNIATAVITYLAEKDMLIVKEKKPIIVSKQTTSNTDIKEDIQDKNQD